MISPVSLLDTAQLGAMASGQPGLLLPIIHDFESRGKEQLHQLAAALAENRFDEGKDILHQLKGSSGTMGMARFADLCRECEGQLTTGQLPPRLDDLVPLLSESVAGARAFLEGECP